MPQTINLPQANHSFENLVDNYLKEKLVPYLTEEDVKPLKNYTLQEAAEMFGIKPSQLLARIRRGTLKDIEDKDKETQLSGLDIAVYELNQTGKPTFTKQDLEELLGTKPINPKELGFTPSQKGNYSPQDFVFPLYHKIAKSAKLKLIKDYPEVYQSRNGEKPTKTFTEILRKDKQSQRQINIKTGIGNKDI
ncbi:hypothetical protein HOE04_00195 [archaeon]|nr:hypothetical protein [archaeon]